MPVISNYEHPHDGSYASNPPALSNAIGQMNNSELTELQSPAEIVDRLRRILLHLQQKEKTDTSNGYSIAPPRNELSTIIQIAFFASLAEEEGRLVPFDLCYASPGQSGRSYREIRFEHPIQLSVEAIRRLAPATVPDKTLIAIFADGRFGTQLSIWGLIIPVEDGQGGGNSLQQNRLLTISTRRPGSFTVKYRAQDLLHYSRGYLSFEKSTEEVDPKTLIQTVAAMLPEGELWKEMTSLAASRLLQVAASTLEAKTGGTLLVLPNSMPKALRPSQYHLDTKHWLLNPKTIYSKSVQRSQAVFRVEDSVRIFSGWMKVDGALVVNKELACISFGTMIETIPSSVIQNIIVDLHSPAKPTKAFKNVQLSEFSGGMRHKSAIEFCFQNPGALALIVSQDGVLTIAQRNSSEPRVIAIRPIVLGSWMLSLSVNS